MSSDVPDLHSLVPRFWQPTLAEHRFAEVAQMDQGGEFQMVIYASPECQLKFIYERGAIVILFGRSNAPRSFSDEANGQTVWYSIFTLLSYEDEIHPDQAYRLPPEEPREEAAGEGFLRTTAALMHPYMPRLIAAFSPRPPDGWWAGFRFSEARDRAKYSQVGTAAPPAP